MDESIEPKEPIKPKEPIEPKRNGEIEGYQATINELQEKIKEKDNLIADLTKANTQLALKVNVEENISDDVLFSNYNKYK